MATLAGWKIEKYGTEGDLDADVSEGQILRLSAADTYSVCGAGENPSGAAHESKDISEDGTRYAPAQQGTRFIGILGSTAITDLDIPLKCGAAGVLVPCDTDLDPIVGWAERTEATAGAYVPYRPAFGQIYGV